MRGWSLVKGGRWEPFVGLSDPAWVLGPCGALRTGLPFAVLSVSLMTSAGWGPVFRRCSLCCGFDPSSKESACLPRARSHRDTISILRRGLASSAQSPATFLSTEIILAASPRQGARRRPHPLLHPKPLPLTAPHRPCLMGKPFPSARASDRSFLASPTTHASTPPTCAPPPRPPASSHVLRRAPPNPSPSA